MSAEGILDACTDGDELIVDADRGEVIVRPTEDVLQQYQQKRDLFLKQREELNVYRGKSSQTKDGVEKEVFCNIGTVEEIESVTENDGEGIGLFRTEFLFLSQSKAPTEEEQFEVYKKVALSMKGRPVIIRTLDVGGDKEIPYMGLKKEENPFLGFRAIRYCLHHEDFFKSQLRALLRASAFGEIQIMLPLVTTVSEIRQAKALIKKIKEELDHQQLPYNKQIKIGTMIETASAAILADVLAHECDFFQYWNKRFSSIYYVCRPRQCRCGILIFSLSAQRIEIAKICYRKGCPSRDQRRNVRRGSFRSADDAVVDCFRFAGV